MSLKGTSDTTSRLPKGCKDSQQLNAFYAKNKGDETPSVIVGTVSEGKLKHGKLLPFFGANYTYFDCESYLASRAFTSDAVKSVILNSYADLGTEYPGRQFYLMELSNMEGGKIYPHRTHQNGLSVDFMMPKLKNNQPNYSLDTLGKDHYFLDFNNDGTYKQDTSIKVDFDLIAKHILLLQKHAQKLGYHIEKVIIKVEYREALFETPNGKLLKNSGIYVVNKLTPLINSLHDDHFHIDFAKQ